MKEKVIEILKRVLGTESVDSSCSQKTCENWDSLRHLNLVIELESEFGVEFEPEEIASMKSVGEIMDILKMKL